MPRPKASPEQHMEAYRLYMGKKGPKAIVDALCEKYGDDAVSERTVATWVKGFKGLSSGITDRDAPFQWHLMDKYGLPWEAGAYLMGVLHATEGRRNRERDMNKEPDPLGAVWTVSPTLTSREALWCWRVHLAAPEVGQEVGRPFLDVLHFARQLAFREIAHEVLGEPLRMADLEAVLAYKPWLSEERHEIYHKALDDGYVLPPPPEIEVRDQIVAVFLQEGRIPNEDDFSKLMVSS